MQNLEQSADKYIVITIDVSFLDNLDSLIKRGKAEEVKDTLQSIKPSTVPRIVCASLAKISLRIGQPEFAFAILRPIIHSEVLLHTPASADELVQYGMCLKQLGATEHALKIFALIDDSQVPEVLLYESVTLFTQWKYAETIPKLQRYISIPQVSDYQKMIGKINLASAYIFEGRYSEVSELLVPLLGQVKTGNHQLLHGNILELLAQVAVFENRFDAAEQYLSEAFKQMGESAANYKLFLEKWTAIVGLFKSHGDLTSLQNLNWVREKAIDLKHWETVRDCDFFFATFKKDEHLFLRLYFGTPYESYRQRLLQRFNPGQSLPDHFDWRGNTAHQPVLGKLESLDLSMRSEDQNLRMLKIFSRDFYSPIKPFPLYLNLFPGERLDPEAALPKVFASVSRTKKWLVSRQIPIEIQNTEAGYRLHWTGPFVIKVPRILDYQESSQSNLEKLKLHGVHKTLSSSQVAELLKIPLRTTIRWLKEAEADGHVEVIGKGRGTRYQVKTSKAS